MATTFDELNAVDGLSGEFKTAQIQKINGVRACSDTEQATWAYRNALADARDPEVKAALAAQDIRAWFRHMPWHKGDSPLSAAPEYEDYLFEQWSHGLFDDYWRQP